MRSTARIMFFVAIGVSFILSLGGHLLASIAVSVCAFGLWLAYVKLYARSESAVHATDVGPTHFLRDPYRRWLVTMFLFFSWFGVVPLLLIAGYYALTRHTDFD